MLQKVTMGFLNQLFRPTYHFNLQLPFYSTTAGLVEVAIGSWLFFLPRPGLAMPVIEPDPIVVSGGL